MGDVDGLHMSAAKRVHLGKEACMVLELRGQPSRALALRAVSADDTAAWMSTCQVTHGAIEESIWTLKTKII